MGNTKNELVSTVKLDKGLRTSGTWCHTASSDGFLTLYVANCHENPNDEANVELNNYLVFNTGYRNIPFRLNISPETNENILENYPVYAGEETWVYSSTPNKFCVYGFFSQKPH